MKCADVRQVGILLVIILSGLPKADGIEPPPRIVQDATGKEFPPLIVPPDYEATLFACDPLVQFPSVIALGPRPGTLLVANDYVKGMGKPIVRSDDIRLLEDTDGDGRADQAPVFASDFGSIQGLEYHNGVVYVMHAPKLTVLQDMDGDGVADNRRDLLDGLGLPPEQNPSRLHCANAVVAGHDGWLYLALGDNGCRVQRPEGDSLIVEGGAILRCRADGSALHVFAGGIRNVYDVALDDHLNVFFRDNENDGGDYMVRTAFSFFGADHGYPYLFSERPEEALPPLADLGRGSSAGVVCYRETQFPPEMRGRLFLCEWGRAVMQCGLSKRGAGFAETMETQFAAGGANDPYGFKPTDLVVLRDGSLMISDWADEQETGRGRARIYRVRYRGATLSSDSTIESIGSLPLAQVVLALNSDSYYRRVAAQDAIMQAEEIGHEALMKAWDANQLQAQGRSHAVWIRAHLKGLDSVEPLLQVLQTDPAAEVRLQAIRAIADLNDPRLSQGWLQAGAGDQELATRLAKTYADQQPHVQREIITTLGRLKWYDAPEWLASVLDNPDPFFAHAAMQAMRQSENWPAILQLLSRPSDDPARQIARRALAGQTQATVAEELIHLLEQEPDQIRLQQYADLLTRIHRKPGPWTYWGYRPGPRPPNSVDWSLTESVSSALNQLLPRATPETAALLLARINREKIPTELSALQPWLLEHENTSQEVVHAVLRALKEHLASDVRPLLVQFIQQQHRSHELRLEALEMLIADLRSQHSDIALTLAKELEDGSVLARLLAALPDICEPASAFAACVAKLDSLDSGVRAASLNAIARLDAQEATPAVAEAIVRQLRDPDHLVSEAAVRTCGAMRLQVAGPVIDELIRTPGTHLRATGFRALKLLNDPRALDLALSAGSGELETDTAAVEYLVHVGDSSLGANVAQMALHRPAQQILQLAIPALARWADGEQATSRESVELHEWVAKLQGQHGVLLAWEQRGPHTVEQAELALNDAAAPWQLAIADGNEGLRIEAAKDGERWLARTHIHVEQNVNVQLRTTSAHPLQIWLNDKLVHEHAGAGADSLISFAELPLLAGRSELRVLVSVQGQGTRFHLQLRQQASSEDHERLIRMALEETGNPQNGRALFHNGERLQCLKCHRMGETGERIGPDLTGIGSRFSRIHLMEAILTPSRSVGAGFQTTTVVLQDGRIITGLVMAQNDLNLTMADSQGQRHVIQVADIDEQTPQLMSIMPDGLEKQLTPAEFVDLVEFLAGQRDE